MTKTIRWRIIGVGDVCEVKSEPDFQKATNSELVRMMWRKGEKAKDFAQRHNTPKWYDSADALISNCKASTDDFFQLVVTMPVSLTDL